MNDLLASGRWVPEGPVLLDDGCVAFVEQERGWLSMLDPETGACEVASQGPAAWNAVTLGSDGHLYGATDGRIFIASVTSHGVTVISPEGALLDHLLVADDACVTTGYFDDSDLHRGAL